MIGERSSRRRTRMGRTPPASPMNFRPRSASSSSTSPRSNVAIEGAARSSELPGLSETSAAATAEEAEEAEAARMRAAVEESYRPRVSEVYGVHVPLGERAARLQCLAVLRLVAGGEDDATLGGGSGSGGEAEGYSFWVCPRVCFASETA